MYHGKTVLITGGSSGIGAALSQEFARNGANVAVLGRRLDRLNETVANIEKAGGKGLALVGDVCDEASLKKAVDDIHRAFGKIDVAIGNAGFGVAGDLERLKLSDYQRQFDTNVFGLLKTVYATLNDLKETRGQLVLVGSVVGFVALPGNSAYSMSKFAVRALAMSLGAEFRRDGITVTHIAPGFVQSEIRQVNNVGKLLSQAKDPIPSWLAMKTPTAARKIFRAISKRKSEAVITHHGKLVVWLAKHFSFLFTIAFRLFSIRARSEPASQQ